jgi:SAM-dependent methyltransferase
MNIWETFYDRHAGEYYKEPWVGNTVEEVSFIEKELSLSKGISVIDIGCGTGRHSIEFAKRGYNVTGLDISDKMLDIARETITKEGLKANFIHKDATNFFLEEKFDLAICLCEGAFGLLSIEEEPFLRDLKILKNIHEVLKDGSFLFMTVSSAIPHFRRWNDNDIQNGIFDLINNVETFKMEDIYPIDAKDITFKSKSFTPVELKMLLKMAGFATILIGGGSAGAWNREKLSIDDHEIMIIGKKQ